MIKPCRLMHTRELWRDLFSEIVLSDPRRDKLLRSGRTSKRVEEWAGQVEAEPCATPEHRSGPHEQADPWPRILDLLISALLLLLLEEGVVGGPRMNLSLDGVRISFVFFLREIGFRSVFRQKCGEYEVCFSKWPFDPFEEPQLQLTLFSQEQLPPPMRKKQL